MGPISNIGPKTSRTAWDRSELNPRKQTNRHDITGASPDDGRRQQVARGTRPRAAATSAALPCAIVRQAAQGSGRDKSDRSINGGRRRSGARQRPAAAKSHFQIPPQVLNTLSLVSMRESRIQYLCDPQWFRDTASRGPTTITAPESQFRTCPSDHGKSV
ncbi:hypothetical protein F511_34965 [Dorcoceras hygrometricum]|uniref:Uncharacterized protein n=1 Tax=Dorcoceras hygrometricum TaxID=472368 RepID=A0A2Z7A585_9LAMI|nr:hypothetical protein F511_34965 [Dorcoceras hygrometricum]